MDQQYKALKIGAAVIALAIFLKLFTVVFTSARDSFLNPEMLSLAVFLQTGRVVRFPGRQETPAATQPPQIVEPEATEPTNQEPALPVFSADDAKNMDLIYGCDYRPDLGSLMASSLSWDLTDGQPAVLIVHTHATEAYTPTAGTAYEESSDYRTLDDRYNMVSIGDEVARVLEEGGIRVIHDRSYHDYPDFNYAYINARKSIAEYLEEYPTIRMVLDIHRDAGAGENGYQLSTSATVGGQSSAQVMVVIGTDASGNTHPNWRTNLALALKLTAQLERNHPGVTRPVYLRQERFNMDMTPGSLLVEVGASGDTHEEAILAANALARGILQLARGTLQ
ncbi:MAG: hypothetical protein E7439_05780 [Ruminococcaceae bacterium]|nr:hypothetical protein [Oscillospiraceae bacterium]